MEYLGEYFALLAGKTIIYNNGNILFNSVAQKFKFAFNSSQIVHFKIILLRMYYKQGRVNLGINWIFLKFINDTIKTSDDSREIEHQYQDP